tara:strand:+ start:19208 stop:20695 length:1488 start_codon:yes stop_codon:yes gene_type:complete
MAIQVQVGDQLLEFPETMTEDEIKQVLRKQFPKQPEPVQQAQAQPEPTLMEKIRGISLEDVIKETGDVIKETPKQVVSDIARLAPYAALPFSKLGLAAQAGITGVSRVVEGVAEGERLPQALKSGAIAAGTESAIGKGLKLGKPALKQVAKFATRAEKGVIDEAIKKPILTKIEPKTNIDTSEQIKNAITILNRKKSREYEKALTKVSEAAKGKVADTKNVNKIIKENKLNRQGLKNVLLAGRSKIKKFDENAVDKFIAGKELTFDEAKNVNSTLAEVMRSTTVESSDKFYVGKLKNSLHKSMEVYPGLKELNEKYAKQATLVQGIEKNLGKDIDESKVNTLTNDVIKRLKDKRQTKSRAMELLKDLDKEVKAKGKRSVANQIEANALQDSISQSISKKSGLIDKILPYGLAGTAVVAPEVALPLAGAKLGQIAMQSEPVARAALKAAQEGVKVPAVIPRITAKAPAMVATPIEREESGGIAPRTLQQIKKERGL